MEEGLISAKIVLKASLVLCEISDISFKVDNFNRTSMLKIEKEWDNITKAIRDALKLISSFGFSRENITSNNLIIPVAYYLKTIGLPNNFEHQHQELVIERILSCGLYLLY